MPGEHSLSRLCQGSDRNMSARRLAGNQRRQRLPMRSESGAPQRQPTNPQPGAGNQRVRHLWAAILLAWGIEAVHLVIADRYFDVTNALISCAGLGIGWLALRRSGFAPHGEALAPLIPR